MLNKNVQISRRRSRAGPRPLQDIFLHFDDLGEGFALAEGEHASVGGIDIEAVGGDTRLVPHHDSSRRYPDELATVPRPNSDRLCLAFNVDPKLFKPKAALLSVWLPGYAVVRMSVFGDPDRDGGENAYFWLDGGEFLLAHSLEDQSAIRRVEWAVELRDLKEMRCDSLTLINV